jgi:potassium-transporting ATPase KdpC subunit
MLNMIRSSVMMLVALALLTGLVYPVAVTVVAQLVFPRQANGSLIVDEKGKPVGSELIGQPFSKPEYFWGRLSATSPVAYNATASGGSNFGPLNPDLKKAAEARIALLRKYSSSESAPVDLVTASGSGLDPHISPSAADFQVKRVAAARKLSEDAVKQLVQKHADQRQFGVLGEARVNVLELNLALDQLQAAK